MTNINMTSRHAALLERLKENFGSSIDRYVRHFNQIIDTEKLKGPQRLHEGKFDGDTIQDGIPGIYVSWEWYGPRSSYDCGVYFLPYTALHADTYKQTAREYIDRKEAELTAAKTKAAENERARKVRELENLKKELGME